MINLFFIVNCEWAEWEIGICSKTCGGGERTKIRDISVEAAHGGEECPESSSMIEPCNAKACPGIYYFEFFFLEFVISY